MYLHFDIHSAFTVPLFFLGTQLIINTYTQYYSTPLYPCILLSFLKTIFDNFRITLNIRVILCCVQQIQKKRPCLIAYKMNIYRYISNRTLDKPYK